MHRELKARLFSRACDIVGSRERLAERLGVEAHALEFWLAARATPPQRLFLSVVDLVLADHIAPALDFGPAAGPTPPGRVFLAVVALVLADDIAGACQDRRQDVAQRALVGALRARAAPPIEKLP